MIWNPNLTGESQVDAIVTHIVSDVTDVVEAGMSLDRGEVEELARGIAYFLEQNGHSASLRSDYLLLLVSRALASVGQGAAAKRYAEVVGGKLNLPQSVVSLVTQGAILPCSWPLFGSRLARPSRWATANAETVWILDMNRIALDSGTCLELALCQGVKTLVGEMACVWDASGGEGVLGLRNVKARLTSLYPSARRRRGTQALTDEIKSLCERTLDSARAARRWTARPGVQLLDM